MDMIIDGRTVGDLLDSFSDEQWNATMYLIGEK